MPLVWHEWGDRLQYRNQCRTSSQNMTSRMHLKNDRCAGNSEYTWNGTASRVTVASRSRVSAWPDGSTSSRNYVYYSILLHCLYLTSGILFHLCAALFIFFIILYIHTTCFSLIDRHQMYELVLNCLCGLVVRVLGYKPRGPGFDSRR
jgi:hypothetical protein